MPFFPAFLLCGMRSDRTATTCHTVQACEMLGGASEVDSIDFSAYTAGTGNAGTTILSATVCERAVDRYIDGKYFYDVL